MNLPLENDGEAALFQREMQEDRLNRNLRRLKNHEPYEVGIGSETLRRLMQRHNQALALLRELLAAHPEEGDLTRRARQLIDDAE